MRSADQRDGARRLLPDLRGRLERLHGPQLRDRHQTVFVEAIETDPATGLTAFDVTVAYSMAPGQNVAGIIDNDFAPFNTTYNVTVKVTDPSGNLLDSQSTAATTPPPR